MSTYDVCLVALPFQNLENPALSLSLLHSCLQNAGIKSKVLYPNMDFADMIGLDKYYMVVNGGSYREALMGEYIFSGAAFGDQAGEGYPEFFSKQLEKFVPEKQLQGMRLCVEQIRQCAEKFISKAVADVLLLRPKIVAVASTTQQNCACIAFCKVLKEMAPEIITIVGGPNCERAMGAELARKIAYFDYVISGEADSFWSEFCSRLLAGQRSFPEFPYIFTREQQVHYAAGVTKELDLMPIPDFSDYFACLEKYSWKKLVEVGLLIESGRGCWWGEKHPCSFCGMNGGSRVFRRKSTARVIEEFTACYEKYGIKNFFAVDCILAMEFVGDVLPALKTLGLNIMYEIKSNMSFKQLQTLKDSGVNWVQPGIEALQDDLLQLMNKGNRAIRHVELLKHARELGIRCCWLLLCNFPNDREEWYYEELELVKKLGHLQPPDAIFKLRYDRFSVYQEQPENYGLKLVPAPAYAHIFPQWLDLDKLAYFFRKEGDATSFYCNDFPKNVYNEMLQQVHLWQQRFESMGAERLEGTITPTGMEIMDLRSCAKKFFEELNGCAAELLLKTDAVVNKKVCLSELAEKYSSEELMQALAELVDNGWLIEINGELLSLVMLRKKVLPAKEEPPSGHIKLMDYRREEYV